MTFPRSWVRRTTQRITTFSPEATWSSTSTLEVENAALYRATARMKPSRPGPSSGSTLVWLTKSGASIFPTASTSPTTRASKKRRTRAFFSSTSDTGVSSLRTRALYRGDNMYDATRHTSWRLIHRSAWKGCLPKLAAKDRTSCYPRCSRPTTKGASLPWSNLFPCLPPCRLAPLGDSAARRACAAFLPCALGTPPSPADASASRALALSVEHVQAAVGRVLVATHQGRYLTSMRSFPDRLSHLRTGCHQTNSPASSKPLLTRVLRSEILRS